MEKVSGGTVRSRRLVVLATLALGAGDAAASTVSSTAQRLDVAAAAGEANEISLEGIAAGTVRIRDAAGIADPVGGECERVDPLTVDCPIGEIHVDAGDLDDSVSSAACGAGCEVHVSGGAGADTLTGGEGTDHLHYDGHTVGVGVDLTRQPGPAGVPSEADRIAGFERVHGGSGPDRLVVGDGMWAFGGDGDDVLIGDDRVQTLYPGAGRNEVRAGGGGDLVGVGGAEPDTVDLGAGYDVLELQTAARIDLADPSWALATDRVTGAEDVLGSAFGDVLLGSEAADIIDGNGASDRIEGRGGDDFLMGDDGDDRVDGGAGNDEVRGDTGNDRLVGGDGDDEIEAGVAEDGAPADVPDADRASGGRGNDRIFGWLGDDTLRGQGGSDLLHGGGGADTLIGGGGRDGMIGESGSDRLLGGPAVDVLLGGTFPDRLNGGPGADVYSGGTGGDRVEARDRTDDTIDCGEGRDRGRADRRDVRTGCELVLVPGRTAAG